MTSESVDATKAKLEAVSSFSSDYLLGCRSFVFLDRPLHGPFIFYRAARI